MKLIRKILVKIFGLKGYLRIVSSIYLSLIRGGFYKKKYAELHFVSRVVRKNDVVLDIGANLGYYSYFIAKKLRTTGTLIGVEPIPLFADLWKKNLKGLITPNIQLENCALGLEAKAGVTMSIPIVNGVVRHGLTKIDESLDGHSAAQSFQVPMKNGDEMLAEHQLTNLNFIKCDVEGYEQYVIPALNNSISLYKPMLQIELGGQENRQNVIAYLKSIGYELFKLSLVKLVPVEEQEILTMKEDFYFVHPDNKETRSELFA